MATTNETNSNVQDDLIYSVQPQQQQYDDIDPNYENAPDAIPQILDLDLRGTRVKLDRETLVSLPESLLIAMFPNGLVLGRRDPSTYDSSEEDEYDEDEEDDQGNRGEQATSTDDILTTFVDFDATCLQYVLKFYHQAQEARDQQQEVESIFASTPAAQYYPSLLDKQPIIVLREELEYYCVVSSSNNKKGNHEKVKLAAGDYLKQHNQVFAALQKNIARENNVAEQHLIDMLCDAGFTREDSWGHRELEPNKTCIVSMSLVLLKTTGPDNHMATAQKLLLFWRKPAVK
jgi:proteasome lid subunit RPN8/RPN11